MVYSRIKEQRIITMNKKKPRKPSKYMLQYGMTLMDMAKRFGGNYSSYSRLDSIGKLKDEIKRLIELETKNMKGKE